MLRQMSQKSRHERLTRREREIMNAVFALGNRASAEEIRARLTSPPSDSSVRVMLARLERLSRTLEANGHGTTDDGR